MILASLQKCKPLGQATRKRNLFILQKEYCAPGTQTLRTLIIASAQGIKSLFVHVNFTQTLCIWTIHVSNKNKSAIVIPTIGGECATHCNCSQKCHTCKQQNIDSCRDV